MEINRQLLNKDRGLLAPTINKMFEVCPEMMSRKIPEANVQQAFILDFILTMATKDTSIFSVGCFEDTVYETLRMLEYNCTGIDPLIDYDLDMFMEFHPEARFDIVFATSVLEHVEDDEAFVSGICSLMSPEGYGIITCDFNDNYVKGASVPATVVRQYTRKDLEERLVKVLEENNCYLIGETDYNYPPDFVYQGHLYSFATFVFSKRSDA